MIHKEKDGKDIRNLTRPSYMAQIASNNMSYNLATHYINNQIVICNDSDIPFCMENKWHRVKQFRTHV